MRSQSSILIIWYSEGNNVLEDPTQWYQDYLQRAQYDFCEWLNEGKGDEHDGRGGKLSATRDNWLCSLG
jgi:hypothetical protein